MELEREDLDSNCYMCENDATTWVVMTDGLRKYFCRECVDDIFRHNTDPEELDEHPICVHCQICGRLTMRDHCPVNQCPECHVDTSDEAQQFLEAIETSANEMSEANTILTDEDGIVVENE